MQVRPVRPADAAEWLRLRLALWPDSPAEQERGEIARYFQSPPLPPLADLQAAFVAEAPGGRLVGLAEVSIHQAAPGCTTDRIGYLEGWYVEPGWRGRGLGRRLVAQAEAWARAQGCREMASDTDEDYPLSPAAHAALGYAEVERLRFRKDL